MIQCDHDKGSPPRGPRCRKKAVCFILLKGMEPAPGLENLIQPAAMVACCAEHANGMLYGSGSLLAREGLTVEEMFLNGHGVLTENYRVLFINDEMHYRGNIGEEIIRALEGGGES